MPGTTRVSARCLHGSVQTRARERGFDLADDVVAYILNRYSRDITALLALLDELDRQSLAQQKRITIPFIRRLFSSH